MSDINKPIKTKLSIITVSFNAEVTIERTIRSVIKNKTCDMEYIIVDGLSNDRTIEIIYNYADHIDRIISEKDNGMYDALNKGIQKASGEFVMLLAADDLFIDGMISKAIETIKDETDVWCGTIIYHNDLGYFYEKSNPNLEELKYHCSLRNPASIFRRSAFKKYGNYDTIYKCVGDRELFLRFYLSGAKFQIEDLPLILFNEGGMSTFDRTQIAIPEGIAISKKYGFEGKNFDKYYEFMIHKEKWKLALKRNPVSRFFIKMLYSDSLYPVICKICGKELNKLDINQILELNLS